MDVVIAKSNPTSSPPMSPKKVNLNKFKNDNFLNAVEKKQTITFHF